MMRQLIILSIALAMVMAPGISAAQMHGGGGMQGGGSGQQHMMGGQGMTHNMDMMNQMTNEMHQMMGQGHMTTEHHAQMQDMMNRMSQMKQQMGSAMTPQMQQQQQRELHEMQQRWNTLKGQIQHQH